VGLSDAHGLLATVLVGEQHRYAREDVLVSLARPADDIAIVEVVALSAKGETAAQLHEEGKLPHRRDPVVGQAVEVTVEHAGVACLAQEDERIRRWLEPWLHEGLECLPGLGVMVLHKGHRMHGVHRDERVVEDLGEVDTAVRAARGKEVVVQRHIEEAHALLVTEIGHEIVHVR